MSFKSRKSRRLAAISLVAAKGTYASHSREQFTETAGEAAICATGWRGRLKRVSSNLFVGLALFFFEARVVGGDAMELALLLLDFPLSLTLGAFSVSAALDVSLLPLFQDNVVGVVCDSFAA
jgi:hypothetical protein